ncbi:hypothetical protein BofuT4_uP044520.1 [Botrytis cinerea T4]|uniref:Uncharacterized protein n=1 Tax=Botryotinia fuckeliana (strain T4) TaxID=999810 RepID=G2XY97_BOTF4|nr:hypothetical protein BofuT4_uP044520.1 [Botrytis cinerea T4]
MAKGLKNHGICSAASHLSTQMIAQLKSCGVSSHK